MHHEGKGLAADVQPHLLAHRVAAARHQAHHEPLHQISLIGSQKLAPMAAQHRLGLHLEQTLGRGVEGGDHAARVHGDDPGGHALEHDLHVAPPLLQLQVGAAHLVLGLVQACLAGLQVRGHAVEGVDQGADLVRALQVDEEIVVPARDALGALGQLHEGHGDGLGQMEAEPGGGEDDEQGDDA